jgi:hypothetical protein
MDCPGLDDCAHRSVAEKHNKEDSKNLLENKLLIYQIFIGKQA